MGCSPSLFNIESCGVALRLSGTSWGSHLSVGQASLTSLFSDSELKVMPKLLPQEFSWPPSSLKSPPAAGKPLPVPCKALLSLCEAGELWRGILAAAAFSCAVLCSARAVSCCFSWEQPEERGPGIIRLRDSPCQSSKVPVLELTATMDMKCWERAKELPAITDRLSFLPGRWQTSLPSQTLFNNRLTEFFWAFLVLKGRVLKQLKRQPTYPILEALFDLLFLWHCLGYPPPTSLQCKFTF